MKRRRFLNSCAMAGVAALEFAVESSQLLDAQDAFNDRLLHRNRVIRFAHLTDIHIYSSRSAPMGLAKALQHVQSLDDVPEFILNGGDAIYDALEVKRAALEEQWRLWKNVWSNENSLPVKHCLGNHDIWGWDKKSGVDSRESGWGKEYSLQQLSLESSYYHFNKGGWQFIVLDSMSQDPTTVYRAELGSEQFQWLTDVLEATPTSTPIVVISHIPILTVGDITWSHELAKRPVGHQMLVHQDRAELLRLFSDYPNVRLCLSGHTHLTERIEIAGISFVNSGAVCGMWWKGDNAHTCEGYNVIDLFDDGSFATKYVDYGWNPRK